MTIQTSSLGKAHVIKLEGRLDAESTFDFQDAWEKSIAKGHVTLILDLTELKYISSAGLGSTVRLAKKLDGLGGSLVLCGLTGLVREVFEVTNLLPLFRVFDTPVAACQSM